MTQRTVAAPQGRLINIRKLAALDILLHGERLILLEFGLGTLVCAVVGLVLSYATLASGRAVSVLQVIFGVYLVLLAINYLPLLIYAVGIIRHGNAREVIAFELAHQERELPRYNRQQFLLLLPLVVPVVALAQEGQWRGHHPSA